MVCQACDMRARRHRLRLGLLAATGLVAAAIGVLAWATDAAPIARGAHDRRALLGAGEEKAADVAVVGMDEQTLEDLELRPPLPRSLHAWVIDRLRRDGAKVIAYDLEFTEPTEVDEDNALFDATARAGNVVLATSRVGPRGQTDVFGGPEGARIVGRRWEAPTWTRSRDGSTGSSTTRTACRRSLSPPPAGPPAAR